MKNKNGRTITDEFSKNLTTSKRKHIQIENDHGVVIYNSVYGTILKLNKIHNYSRFIFKSPSIAERVIRTLLKFLNKPVFEKGNASWVTDLPSVKKTMATLYISQQT